MTSTLREEITSCIDDMYSDYSTERISEEILKRIEKRIDKVEQDYKNELNDWGRQQPMKDMWPKEMATLKRVRKELGIKKKK